MGTESKSPIALELRNVSLSFYEKKVLSDINLKLGRGEMIFVTGLSASGKSVPAAIINAENGTPMADYVTSNPWDRTRLPAEKIL